MDFGVDFYLKRVVRVSFVVVDVHTLCCECKHDLFSVRTQLNFPPPENKFDPPCSFRHDRLVSHASEGRPTVVEKLLVRGCFGIQSLSQQ